MLDQAEGLTDAKALVNGQWSMVKQRTTQRSQLIFPSTTIGRKAV